MKKIILALIMILAVSCDKTELGVENYAKQQIEYETYYLQMDNYTPNIEGNDNIFIKATFEGAGESTVEFYKSNGDKKTATFRNWMIDVHSRYDSIVLKGDGIIRYKISVRVTEDSDVKTINFPIEYNESQSNEWIIKSNGNFNN